VNAYKRCWRRRHTATAAGHDSADCVDNFSVRGRIRIGNDDS